MLLYKINQIKLDYNKKFVTTFWVDPTQVHA